MFLYRFQACSSCNGHDDNRYRHIMSMTVHRAVIRNLISFLRRWRIDFWGGFWNGSRDFYIGVTSLVYIVYNDTVELPCENHGISETAAKLRCFIGINKTSVKKVFEVYPYIGHEIGMV